MIRLSDQMNLPVRKRPNNNTEWFIFNAIWGKIAKFKHSAMSMQQPQLQWNKFNLRNRRCRTAAVTRIHNGTDSLKKFGQCNLLKSQAEKTTNSIIICECTFPKYMKVRSKNYMYFMGNNLRFSPIVQHLQHIYVCKYRVFHIDRGG